jgi:ribosomal protein S18 acetylase RimI-like enzyme
MPIRSYCADDWPAVREIYDLSKPDELRGVLEPSAIPHLDVDPEMLALFRNSQIVVMEQSNRVIGFGGIRGSTITWLFVHPQYRRKGVGAELVRALLTRIEGPVTLNVVADNLAARRLYERLGFAVEREFLGKFKGHECRAAKLRYDKSA